MTSHSKNVENPGESSHAEMETYEAVCRAVAELNSYSVSCGTRLNTCAVPNYDSASDVVLPKKSRLSMGSAELVLFHCLHKG